MVTTSHRLRQAVWENWSENLKAGHGDSVGLCGMAKTPED